MTPKSPPDITVFDIANWFLATAKSEGMALKHMKLQKLVYFTYGWYYAIFDRLLFDEKIHAWRFGPVVKSLYQKFRPFGKHPIKTEVAEIPEFDDDVISVLRQVWKTYSPSTDLLLSAITHRPESPWRKVYYDYGRWNDAISPEMIRDYFKTLMNKYKNERAGSNA